MKMADLHTTLGLTTDPFSLTSSTFDPTILLTVTPADPDLTYASSLDPNSTEGALIADIPPGPNYPYYTLGFTAASAFIIAILGTFGNLLTIIALPLTKKLRTTATAFVVNLAIVELLFCVFILPMSGAQYLYLQQYSIPLLTDQHCIFFVALRYGLTQVELQTILAIALTRALAVATPRMYTTINRTRVIGSYIAFIWLYSFFLKLPPALEWMGRYEFNTVTMECDLSNNDPVARLVYILIEAVIPVLLIFILYIFVFVMVVRRAVIRNRKFSHSFPPLQQQVKMSSARVARASVRGNKTKVVPPPPSTSNTSSTTTAPPGGGGGEGAGGERKGSSSSFQSLKRLVSESSLSTRFARQSSTVSQRLSTSRRDLRVARTIFTIFVLMLVCSVPVMVIHVVDRKVSEPNRFLLLHVLYWIQYCLNVAVYVLMNRQYRDAYIDCMAKVFPRFKRHHGRRFFWERASVSSKPAPNLTSTKPGGGTHYKDHNNDSSIASEADPGPSPGGQGASALPQGKLNTIPEGHSSSAANDSVFSDPGKKSQDSQDSQESAQNLNHAPPHRFNAKDSIDEEHGRSSSEDREEGSEERSLEEEEEEERRALMDKELWVTQNGEMGTSLPGSESKV